MTILTAVLLYVLDIEYLRCDNNVLASIRIHDSSCKNGYFWCKNEVILLTRCMRIQKKMLYLQTK